MREGGWIVAGVALAAMLDASSARAIDDFTKWKRDELRRKALASADWSVAKEFEKAGLDGVAVAKELAASDDWKAAAAGRRILLRLPGPAADDALLAATEAYLGEPGSYELALECGKRGLAGRRASEAVAALEDGASRVEKRRLLTAVAGYSTSAQIPALESLASNRDADVRRVAVTTLQRIGSDHACAAIHRIAGDQGRRPADEVIAALVTCKDTVALDGVMRGFPGEIRTLFDCGNSIGNVPEYSEALARVVALGPATLPDLRRLAMEGSGKQRLYALFAMTNPTLDVRENVPLIRMALSDRVPAVRDLAASMLQSRADVRSARLVRPLLADSDPLVRLSAAETLAAWGDVSAVPVLIDLVRTPPPPAPTPPLRWRSSSGIPALSGLLGFTPASAQPYAGLMAGPPSSAAATRAADEWDAWWKANGATFHPIVPAREDAAAH